MRASLLVAALALAEVAAFSPASGLSRVSTSASPAAVTMLAPQKRPKGGGMSRGQFKKDPNQFKRKGPKTMKKRPKGGGLSRGEFKKNPNQFKRSGGGGAKAASSGCAPRTLER